MTRRRTDPEDLKNNELMDLYSHVVRRNHYDPMCSDRPEYTESELEDELFRRLAVYARHSAT